MYQRPPILAVHLTKITTRHILHGKIAPRASAMQVENSYDVGVRQTPGLPALLTQDAHVLIGLGQAGIDDLQGHLLVELEIVSQPYLADVALTEQPLKLEAGAQVQPGLQFIHGYKTRKQGS